MSDRNPKGKPKMTHVKIGLPIHMSTKSLRNSNKARRKRTKYASPPRIQNFKLK